MAELLKKYNTVKKAVDYLTRMGWKVSVKSFYRHISNGYIDQKPWDEIQLDEYASRHLKPIGETKTVKSGPKIKSAAAQLVDDRRKKIQVETELKELELQIKRDEYIGRVEVERQFALRATFLRNEIENFIRKNAGEMVALADGDATRVPDVIDFWLDRSEIWMAQYAEDREFQFYAV